MPSEARKVYDEAIVIDGLNVSNWESDAVFRAFASRQYHRYQRHGGNVGKFRADHGAPSGVDAAFSRAPRHRAGEGDGRHSRR